MRIKEKLGEIPITANMRTNRFQIPALGFLTQIQLVVRDLACTSSQGAWNEDAGMHLFNRIELIAGATTIRAMSGRAAFHRWRLDHRHQPYYLEGALSTGDGSFDLVLPIDLTTPRSHNPLATALNVGWFGRDGVNLQITFGAGTDLLATDGAITAGQAVEVIGIYEESLNVAPAHFRVLTEQTHVCDDGANSQESISFNDLDGLRSVMFICTDAASDLTKDAGMDNHGIWRWYGNTLGEGRKRIEEWLYELAWLDTYHEAGLPELTHDGLVASAKHNHYGILERHWDIQGQLDTLAVRSKWSNLFCDFTGVNAAADKVFYTTELLQGVPGMPTG